LAFNEAALKDKIDKHFHNKELYLMALDNFIYYIWKWKLPVVLAENLAYDCHNLDKPREYVDSKLEFYAKVFGKTNDLYHV
jgi:hypothetical protein